MNAKELILSIITHPAGFDVGCGDLQIFQLEDGRFAVWLLEQETIFNNAKDAADYFLKLRHDGHWGFDYEMGGS